MANNRTPLYTRIEYSPSDLFQLIRVYPMTSIHRNSVVKQAGRTTTLQIVTRTSSSVAIVKECFKTEGPQSSIVYALV